MEAAAYISTFNNTKASSVCFPSDYVLPEEKRPDLSQVSVLNSIPVIDLKDCNEIIKNEMGSSQLVQQVSRACEEFGFFQIVNHGVPQELCDRMMSVITDFFELPTEDKKEFYSTDPTKPVRLFSYYLKNNGSQEKVSMWSESFSHLWLPFHELSHLLPANPPQYREVYDEYEKEIGRMVDRLLSLISLGLGLEQGCLKKKLGPNPGKRAQSNYYPPCPNPELTLGLNVHTDISALTVLRQSEGVSGLQVIKDGKWVMVDPIPNAFVINLGDQIQVNLTRVVS